MHRLVISCLALITVLGCSGDRERRSAAVPDTSREGALARLDTAPPPAQVQVPTPKASRPVTLARQPKSRHRLAAKRPRPAAAVPVVPSDSATAPPPAGYAPRRDTLGEPAPGRANSADTAERPLSDSTAPMTGTPRASPPTRTTTPTAATGTDSARRDARRDTILRAPPPNAPSQAGARNAQNAHTLPVGTEIRAVLQDSIDSRMHSKGHPLHAEVAGGVMDPAGTVLVPAGSKVRLTITRLEPAKSRSADDGKLSLRVDTLTINGRSLPVTAHVQAVPHELRGRGITAGEAEKVGAGAAAGAVAGGVITGKTRGAVIGGVVGAAGGAVVAAQTASRDVVVHQGTTVVFTLAAPLIVAAQ
jgi:hypothetical protein